MAKARAIIKRLKAVKNIRKITRTMELIATARFKKAMDRAAEARAYTEKIAEIVGDLAAADLSFSHPLLERRDSEERVLVLVLTSNRGLCGGYNSAVLRLAGQRLRELNRDRRNVVLEVSGKRGLAYFKFEGKPIERAFTHFEDKPSFEEVDELASRFAELYTSGAVDRIDVVYTQFQSISRQYAVRETLLPFENLTAGTDTEDTKTRSVDYEFLPSAEAILEEIVPAAFKAKLFKCFLDAAVSEQIARMVAMKGATENADEMIGSLSTRYNRARQSQITSELSEIIGGAAALE
ncbi:ATP synthase F1 subunit gamma [Rubinisphaera margarita]|uniref:ATP synthase F1 subunit gamma n=1 Tax=Rubinisphaera margarita TaxID=2909586 RepID=UPI001EE98B22|nr:ATP synthase F1 subunit gamma [Rubinisphaera margarita]MCG6157555.1 ATP synthase F1 subunit gamma [Rubinisphaera margarita]